MILQRRRATSSPERIVAAGVVVPIGAVLLALWLLWSFVLRRVRLRWEQLG